MAGMKEIRGKIKSVQNTRKITKAMEMVAASKMRRAQERMRHARPYADKVRDIAAHMAQANPEYKHPFMVKHAGAKHVGVVLVTTDKGLCGGMNTNVMRAALNKFKELEQQGLRIEATAIGGKGLGFLSRLNAKVVSQVVQLGDTPHLEKLIGAVKVQLDAYAAGQLDAVYIGYTRFVNTMKQEAVIEQLLPLDERFGEREGAGGAGPSSGVGGAQKHSWDYLYEPDAQTVVDDLLVRYVEALVYQAVAENMASEQSARMVAMKAASDNAKTVIHELQLVYNKSRQAAITKELSEIVGGAAAV
ncbi:F0F1 ATP synthase subunit gamma [Pararobbsia silviterrae]|uniref:ATP synthase gamma chain n=1 Tax=Pararobbsia silviterrae TaxID=1792498 RepID=A0A494Y764_9BURK|nr:F0F1 ATP synthase subunit gamma [Pararobbsia silviterrae]RKP58484.1 F0F1 ATP synthase subunit gamma [Pararobbsia silviterrae]